MKTICENKRNNTAKNCLTVSERKTNPKNLLIGTLESNKSMKDNSIVRSLQHNTADLEAKSRAIKAANSMESTTY